jgi:hypothetical protein
VDAEPGYDPCVLLHLQLHLRARPDADPGEVMGQLYSAVLAYPPLRALLTDQVWDGIDYLPPHRHRTTRPWHGQR